MPFYELECKKCKEQYDVNSLISEMDKNIKKAKCPECGSKSKKRIYGGFSFNFGNPIGTDRWNSGSTGHDYRYKHDHERPGGTRDQRENAKKHSHMGTDPYPHIDDVSGGEHFGEVK